MGKLLKERPELMDRVPEHMRADPGFNRQVAGLPEPMILEMHRDGEKAGMLWAYMILYHEVSCEILCRDWCATIVSWISCGLCGDSIAAQRDDLSTYTYHYVGEPVAVYDKSLGLLTYDGRFTEKS